MEHLKDRIKKIDPEFFESLDPNLRLFAREIKKELRDEGHVVIGITGYPNSGKSNFFSILGMLVDDNYEFTHNICFIPTSKEIEDKYMQLKMYSVYHIDEASRGLHKHKWHDKVQQKLNELYDTEREGHYLCTGLIMPRFQNFTENFRNFMIKYWVNLPIKGLAVFYKRDEDKDTRDPWHLDESYKAKLKSWKGKRVFERGLPEQLRAEQKTDCYWFYCKVPPIPKDIWAEYQELKKASRVRADVEPVINEGYNERVSRERKIRLSTVADMYNKGMSHAQICAQLNVSSGTVKRYIAELRALEVIGTARNQSVAQSGVSNSTIIYNRIEPSKIISNQEDLNKQPFVKPKELEDQHE